MNYNVMQNSKKYLCRFDEILNQMASKMLYFNQTNSITLYFIECMIPHHQAAIYMCENLLKYTRYLPLQRIANNIISMQTNGINQMIQIAKTTSYTRSNRIDIDKYLTKYLYITKNMIYKMKNAPRCQNISLNFVNEMIPHHEGAIEMCNNLLMYQIDSRLKTVAQSIIINQNNGVKQLEEVRRNLCKQ